MNTTDGIGEPLYMFDRDFYNDSSLPSTLKPPTYFQIQDGVDDSIFFLGSDSSGVSFHKHADAWNGVIYGRKRWFLYPTKTTPPGGVYPGYTQREWFNKIYPTLEQNKLPIECIQEAGEILYLPEGMYHGTINIGDTIAVGIQKKAAVTKIEKLFYKEPKLLKKIKQEQDTTIRVKLVKRAFQLYETLLSLSPDNSEIHMKLGRLHNDEGHFKKAVLYTKRALELDKHFIVAVLQLAGIHNKMGELDEAEKLYKEAVQMNPNLWDVYAQYGDFLLQNDRPHDAANMYQKGTILEPENIQFWTQLHRAQQQMGDVKGAKISQDTLHRLQEKHTPS